MKRYSLEHMQLLLKNHMVLAYGPFPAQCSTYSVCIHFFSVLSSSAEKLAQTIFRVLYEMGLVGRNLLLKSR